MIMLERKGLQNLKMAHLLVAFMWLGGAAGLLLINFLVVPTTGDQLYMKLRAMQVIDDFLIIPGATGNLLVGLVYGIWTRWGFFKHRWLLVKWILTVSQILFGTFLLGPWLNGNVALAAEYGLDAMSRADFIINMRGTTLGGLTQFAVLCSYLWISVVKPWKNKKS